MTNERGQDASFWDTVGTVVATSEGAVEQRVILPLLAALGYPNHEITPKHPIIFQTGRRGRRHEADFVVHEGPTLTEDTSLLVIEAKAPEKDLTVATRQAESYAHAIRAPFLVLCDGERLEIWQMQAARRSVRALACHVAELVRHRGAVERLIGRSAAVAHCRSLGYKPLAGVAGDVSAYVASELARLEGWRGIARRLQLGGKPVPALDALDGASRGAFVTAPSGFGKSTLAIDAHRHWLCTLDGLDPIPFLITLADIAELDQSPADYARDRLSAHCPQFRSTASFQDLLASRGARLILDGMDRMTNAAQRKLLARAATLARDQPKVCLILLGRQAVPNSLGLPTFALAPLDRREQEEVASLVCPGRGSMALYRLPRTLDALLDHPLLLTLLLRHVERTNVAPARLDEIFESWVTQLLEADARTPEETLCMRRLLTRFATAKDGEARAKLLVEVQARPDEPLGQLVATGALVLNAGVELQHDALADHLRAEALARTPVRELLRLLSKERLPAGSLFPALLMSACKDEEHRDLVWRRLTEEGPESYLDALRFGGAPEEDARTDLASRGRLQLREFREGVVAFAQAFMAPLEQRLFAKLVWKRADRLGVKGGLDADGRWLTYEFRALGPEDPAIETGKVDSHAPVGGFDLGRTVGSRGARQIGFDLLRGALADVICARRLEGGPLWRSERVIGRLRWAARHWKISLDPSSDLQTLERALAPRRDEVLNAGGASKRAFSVAEIIEDIQELRGYGWQSADLWWSALAPEEIDPTADRERASRLLDEYWRRTQLVLAEVVRHSMPALAPALDFHCAMPARFEVGLHDIPGYGLAMHHTWRPIADWQEAGGDVEFGWRQMYDDGLHDRTMTALAGLGRTGCTSISYVQGAWPRFDGSRRHGSFDGETAVLRNALSLLVADLDRLFERLPGKTIKSEAAAAT